MDQEETAHSGSFVMKFLELNPKPFKSFFSRFITERVGDTGLTESQIVFLMLLDREEGMSLKEMTEKIGVHKSLTTRAVKHLTEQGFVINTAESGKEHCVVLTAEGAKAKETAVKAFDALFELIMEDLSEEELMMMGNVLSKIRQKIEELSSSEHAPADS